MHDTVSRRDFLAAGAAAVSLAAVESARGYVANDTLNVAGIGTGGFENRLRFPRHS